MNDRKLRVWWVPQIPMHPFYVTISSLEEGDKIMDVLAKYDIFQYENNIKSDYTNVGGIQMYDPELSLENDDGWIDWWDEETGIDDVKEFLEYKSILKK